MRRQDSNLRPPGYELRSRGAFWEKIRHIYRVYRYFRTFSRRKFRPVLSAPPAFFGVWVKTWVRQNCPNTGISKQPHAPSSPYSRHPTARQQLAKRNNNLKLAQKLFLFLIAQYNPIYIGNQRIHAVDSPQFIFCRELG